MLMHMQIDIDGGAVCAPFHAYICMLRTRGIEKSYPGRFPQHSSVSLTPSLRQKTSLMLKHIPPSLRRSQIQAQKLKP